VDAPAPALLPLGGRARVRARRRPGRSAFDAQHTSANTANPNGKILRIVPIPDGPGHTIPDGNLFVDDDPKTLPEIYAMGFRSPFRFKVDPETGWIGMGDYGPDANAADPARGPQGSVEFNLITEPGNFGWPYCIRDNVPYVDFQFPDGPSGLPFNCASPVNDSPNNTGLENLPPAVPATMWLGYTETDARFPGLGTGGAPMGGPIYHYDPDNPSPTKFPEEFDGKWFIGEWNENWIKTVTLDDEGQAHAGENWTIETKLSGTISGGNSQGGLIAFGDTDNYVKIDAVARPNPGGRISQIELRSEVNRSPQSPQPNVNVPEGTTDIWLRLTKQGTTYSGAYSFDGENWTAISGSVSNPMESPRFGVYALGAAQSGEEVSFDYFRVDGRPGTDNPCVCVIPADDFEAGELDRERWNWIVREDESLYRFEDGVLWIETPPGDIYQNQNPSQTRNFILQDGARGGDNWAIETKVLVGNLNANYQQGGLIAYADDNNYVKLDAVADTSSQRAARVELVSEQNGSAQRREANVPEGVTEIWLRLNKQGNTYSGAYSFDGESWQTVSGTLQNQLQSPGFGIYTLGTGAPGPEVGFEYFDFIGEIDCPVVNDPPAIASVTADPAHGFAPLEVSFSVQVTDGDGDPLSYAWDFGDGGTAEGPSPTHTYTEPGAYEAKVTVSDGASQRSRKVEVLVLPEDDPSARFRALVFSKTEGFRHDSIPAGHAAIDELAEQHDFQVDHTEDASLFEPAILDRYDTVVFLSTTGDVLNAQQEAAFEEYIRDGGGFVGVHAAADTEYDWAWYGDLVGAYFMSHPPGTATADVVVEDHEHPSTASLPDRYEHEDEWYNFESPDFFGFADEDYSPRGTVHVLASVDEETYDEQDGTPEADDHPITWCQRFDGGRSWYTGMGHTAESFSEEHFLTQLLGGLETTAGVTPSEPCGEVPGVDTKPPRSTARLNPDSPGPGGTYDQPVEVIFEATDGDREPPEPQTHDVNAEGFEWDPDRLEITAGDEVRWNFPETAGAGHDVWLIPPGGDEDDAFEVSDGVVSPGGDPVSYTLDEPGRWRMFCSLHPGMDGLIDVDPAPAPASGVDYVEYRVITGLDATEWTRLHNSDDDEPFVASVVISDEGEHTVEFRSVDRAGNRELSRSLQFTVVPPAPCVAYSDEFYESDPKWAFRHPTSPLTLVTGGSLLFFLGSGEIDQDGTGPINFIGQPIPEGDFEIATELWSTGLAGDGSGPNGYAQAGLMLYQSDDNFVKVTRTRAAVFQPADQGKTFFEVGAETDGVIARSSQVGLAADNPDTWWLRLVREGDELTAYYATESPAEDGEWNEIPMSDGMDLSEIMPPENGPIYMGLYGANGSTSVSARWFRVAPDVDCDPPVIEELTAEPASGTAPLEVAFSVTASDEQVDELTYEWDFGDGSPVSDEEAPTHVYAEPGTYDATVTVSDGTDEVSESVRIEVGGLPRLAVTVKPKSRAIRAAKRRVAYRVVLRNDGNAAAEGVKVCAKAKKKLLAVKGKACRTVSVSRGERVKQRFVLKVKPAARGKRTRRSGSW